LAWLDHMVAEGFLKQKHRDLLLMAGEPEELLDRLSAWRPAPRVEKWLEREVR
jgi:predicted Rossmann-fold nucleotide-binding protein